MITVEEAIAIIMDHTVDFGTEKVPLSNAINRVLKTDWFTDRDLPPYDRVTMDGIAIQFAHWENGQRAFTISGVAAAGMEPQTLSVANECLEVMTGAILPQACDTVIRYEDVNIVDGVATITAERLRFQQNIHFKGEDRLAGSKVVAQHTVLSSAEIGVGASIGMSEVKVARLPKVMVISTGDELVEIDEQPAAYQIRRSNVYRLMTSLKAYQIEADMDHLADDPVQIRAKLKSYLETYDVILLSGGVSKGKFDFLPSVLADLGVEKLFHKIKQRPGKPFWFGRFANKCTIFALPGNPISSFLCTERYFKSWLQQSLLGAQPSPTYAVLEKAVDFKPDLTYFLEVSLRYTKKGELMATPKRGNGSGDLANLVEADAFMELPRGQDHFAAGLAYPVYRYR